jgi:hypothetical protein
MLTAFVLGVRPQFGLAEGIYTSPLASFSFTSAVDLSSVCLFGTIWSVPSQTVPAGYYKHKFVGYKRYYCCIVWIGVQVQSVVARPEVHGIREKENGLQLDASASFFVSKSLAMKAIPRASVGRLALIIYVCSHTVRIITVYMYEV